MMCCFLFFIIFMIVFGFIFFIFFFYSLFFSFCSFDVSDLDIIREELGIPVFDSEDSLHFDPEEGSGPSGEEEGEEEVLSMSNENLPRRDINNFFCDGFFPIEEESFPLEEICFTDDQVLGIIEYKGVFFYVLSLDPFCAFYSIEENFFFIMNPSLLVPVFSLKNNYGFSLDCRGVLFKHNTPGFNFKHLTIKSRVVGNGSLWVPFVFKTKPKHSDFSPEVIRKECTPYFRQRVGFMYLNKNKEFSYRHTFFSSYYVLSSETKFSLIMSHFEGLPVEVETSEDIDVFNLYSYTIRNHLCFNGDLGFRFRRVYEYDFINKSEMNVNYFKKDRFTKKGDRDPGGFIVLSDMVEIDDPFDEIRPFPFYYKPRPKACFSVREGSLYPTSFYMDVCESSSFWDFYREYTFNSRTCYSFWFCSPICNFYVYHGSLLTVNDFFSEFFLRTYLTEEELVSVEGYGFYDRMFPEPFNKAFDLLDRKNLLLFRSKSYLSRLYSYSMPSYLRLSNTDPYSLTPLKEIYINTYVRSLLKNSSFITAISVVGKERIIKSPSAVNRKLFGIHGKLRMAAKSWSFIERLSDLGSASESSKTSFLNCKNISIAYDKHVFNELAGSSSRKLLKLRLRSRLLLGDVNYNGSPVLSKFKTAEIKRELIVNDMFGEFGEERKRLIEEAGKSNVRKFEVCFDSSAFEE